MAKKTPHDEEPAGDFMEVGKEVVPGMRLRCICRGHQGPIGRIAWSPCGRFIASPSQDKTIRIWDAENGKCLAVLEGHENYVRTVAWENGIIASGAAPKESFVEVTRSTVFRKVEFVVPAETQADSLLTWEANERKKRASLLPTASVTDVVFSPTRETIAVSIMDGTIHLVSSSQSQVIKSFQSQSSILSLKWFDENTILVGTLEGEIELFDLATETRSRAFNGHSDCVFSISVISDSRIVSASGDGTLRVWDVTGGETLTILEGHSGDVRSVCLSANGELIASKDSDNLVSIWSVSNWDQIGQFTEVADQKDAFSGIAFHPREMTLATLGEGDTVIRIWELSPRDLVQSHAISTTVHYASAKIVLVGESNVGKSCLAMRLAERRYPEDHEHGTT